MGCPSFVLSYDLLQAKKKKAADKELKEKQKKEAKEVK